MKKLIMSHIIGIMESGSKMYIPTINSDNNVRDLIPYSPNELKGPVDDLAISKSSKTGDIMRHGYMI